MEEESKYHPYNSEDELRRAMCIHEAGHIVVFYYVFGSIDSFEWAMVDMEEYFRSEKKLGVETNYKEYPLCEKYILETRNYSFEKYTYILKLMCCHLGGGFCQKHLEELDRLPKWSMGADNPAVLNGDGWFKFKINNFDCDQFEKRKEAMIENAELYLDWLFSIGTVQGKARKIASILEEKSKSDGDKKIYSKDIIDILKEDIFANSMEK